MQNYHNILQNWYLAQLATQNNPKILIEARNKNAEEVEKTSHYCHQLMQKTNAANQQLYDLEITDDMPEPLKEHLMAEKDKGCGKCWLSSIRLKKHTDGSNSCWTKISRWFNTKEILKQYAKNLLANAEK